ncbi:hypothetical protein EHQ92_17210 [Leptospira biflexa]|nr:hypothetical protein [Leptospira biflexa]TGM42525.1 hypothetical protein EHQ92_17210 [Leptospira biflexa]TGM44411.1 hypothetical protein EHQ88_17545 [Leptospira biflexa]TGM57381.1 hypothetical protein EHQ91_00555 [Leptospira biflexa]
MRFDLKLTEITTILIVICFSFSFSCVGDLYFDTKNDMDESMVSRDYALRQFYSAVIVKRSLCPQNIDLALLSGSYHTSTLKGSCDRTSFYKNSEKSLRSCKSLHTHVEKKDLVVCINEILFYPCETIQKANSALRPNFPICRGLFGPGPGTPLSM